MIVFCKKMQKNLVISKKSSTFAPAFRLEKQDNGVMPLPAEAGFPD